MQCPECGSDLIRRSSRRKPLDWVLSLLGMRPYRCEVCRRRFYHLPDMIIPRHGTRESAESAGTPQPLEVKKTKKRRKSPSGLLGRLNRWKSRNSSNILRRVLLFGAVAVTLALFLTLISRAWSVGAAP